MATCKVDGCKRYANRKGQGVCEMHYYRKRRNGSYELPVAPKRFKPIEFRENENGCFEVVSHKQIKGGYFLLRMYGTRISMHRHVYQQCFGDIPEGFVIRHKCDNKKCINPEHLDVGTIQDNSRDAVERGRYLKGEKHKQAKLTEMEVIKIRNLVDLGMQHKEIAKMFNIDKSTVSDIKRRKIWRHIS